MEGSHEVNFVYKVFTFLDVLNHSLTNGKKKSKVLVLLHVFGKKIGFSLSTSNCLESTLTEFSSFSLRMYWSNITLPQTSISL